jgi:hypothetical protein
MSFQESRQPFQKQNGTCSSTVVNQGRGFRFLKASPQLTQFDSMMGHLDNSVFPRRATHLSTYDFVFLVFFVRAAAHQTSWWIRNVVLEIRTCEREGKRCNKKKKDFVFAVLLR